MLAYNSIGFSGGNFSREVIYPIYYFVHGSFDNEREKLDSKNIACKNEQISISTAYLFIFFFSDTEC
jgi:hypothetical protein